MISFPLETAQRRLVHGGPALVLLPNSNPGMEALATVGVHESMHAGTVALGVVAVDEAVPVVVVTVAAVLLGSAVGERSRRSRCR